MPSKERRMEIVLLIFTAACLNNILVSKIMLQCWMLVLGKWTEVVFFSTVTRWIPEYFLMYHPDPQLLQFQHFWPTVLVLNKCSSLQVMKIFKISLKSVRGIKQKIKNQTINFHSTRILLFFFVPISSGIILIWYLFHNQKLFFVLCSLSLITKITRGKIFWNRSGQIFDGYKRLRWRQFCRTKQLRFLFMCCDPKFAQVKDFNRAYKALQDWVTNQLYCVFISLQLFE